MNALVDDYNEGNVDILDVRTAQEIKQYGKLEVAISIPLAELNRRF